jgi:hypothetical protein
MPVYLRSFYFNQLIEAKTEEQKQAKEAERKNTPKYKR